jgi:hypothetical protein
MGLRWYTIFTKPHKEAQVRDYLQSKNIEIYFPTLHVKPVNPRSATVHRYFPSYLFARANLAEVGVSWLAGFREQCN